jgi:acetyltransferase-like isoleucine patch superfamily enzyme
MASDEHAVVDLASGEFLNPSRSILFEPHVWVGFQALILKGVKCGYGSVVGARSVVTRDVPERSVMAGNPARLIRQGVEWVRDREPSPAALNGVAALYDNWRGPQPGLG